MSLKSINDRIAKVDPCVELIKGSGYHYYTFDNVAPGQPPMAATEFVVGDQQVFETESVYTCYTMDRKDADWVRDGIEFGKRIRSDRGLPLVGETDQ